MAGKGQIEPRCTKGESGNPNVKLKGVAVVLNATHLCMSMRGINKPDAITTTSEVLGIFRTDEKARNEFLNLINKILQ